MAYGTSAPELAVSVSANLNGSSGLVLGNIIGSCVANLALILGVTALIAPPAVEKSLIKRELPVLMISALSLPFFLLNGVISTIEAMLLFGFAIAFSLWTVFFCNKCSDEDLGGEASQEKNGQLCKDPQDIAEEENLSKPILALLTVVGLAVLVGGGDLFVKGAKGIAFMFGMSDHLVGMTVVAIGTSLPELAASIVAALRGMSGLAVGNVVGSNIFNIFLVLGVTGLFAPLHGDLGALKVDIGFMLILTLVAILFMRGDRVISRIEGGILLASYVFFIGLSIAMA